MKSQRRSRTLASILGAATALTLVACTGSSRGPQEEAEHAPVGSDEEVEITIWFGREDFIPDDAFAEFMAEYPHITVKTDVVPLEQIPTNFIRQYEAGDAPDIIQPEAGATPSLALRGMLYDVTPILEEWESSDPDLYGAMSQTAWDLASDDGTPYGMTLFHGVDWNLYRTDVLDDLGLEVPTTWDEVLDAAEVISDETDMYGYGLDGARTRTPDRDKGVFAQMGGQWVDGVMQLDSEAGHYWLNFYQELVLRDAIDPATIALEWPDYIQNFAEGEHAMGVMSRNVFLDNVEPLIAYGEEWSVNPSPYVRPGAEAEARYLTRGWPYLVSSATEYPYEAGLVLRYLAEDQQALSVALRYQPASNTRVMASDEYFQQNPWGEDLVAPWSELEARPSHPNNAAMDSVIRDAIQEALNNPTADVAEVAQRYQEELDALAAEVEN